MKIVFCGDEGITYLLQYNTTGPCQYFSSPNRLLFRPGLKAVHSQNKESVKKFNAANVIW